MIWPIASVALLLAAVSALAARHVPVTSHLVLYWVIASPYLMPLAPVALVILGWGRHWALAALATLVTAALAALQWPSYVSALPPPDSVRIRVMTANLRYGQANSRALTDLAVANADVVMLQELTPEATRGLTAAGLDQSFPHHALDDRDGPAGVGVYSRYPISSFTRIGEYALAMVSARVRVNGVGREVTLLSVHLAAPWPRSIHYWQNDIAEFPSTLSSAAAHKAGGAVIVGGDFNSTVDMQAFRRLLTNGYADAAGQAGSRRNRTYPASRWCPPLLGIDHVLTRNATASSTSTVEIPGTDHRALLATVMVPSS